MIGGNNVIEMDLIEQLALIAFSRPIIASPRPSTWCEDGIIVRH
jgi:hypothetical protein